MEDLIVKKLIGSMIKEARNGAGLTQTELAEKLGVSRISVANFENGSQGLSFSKAVQLAQILKISLDNVVFEASRRDPDSLLESKSDNVRENLVAALRSHYG